MHKLRSSSVAELAKVFSRLSSRLKNTGGRPSAPLGSRILTNPDDIFKHNMWDHVQWTEEDKENARQKAEENSSIQIPLKEQGRFDTEACKFWDKFYEMHQDKFFKDRRWLFLEFPELLPSGAKSQATNTCLHDQQQATDQISAGPGTETETRHQQHSGPTHHHRSTDTSSHQKSCQEAAAGKNEAVAQTKTFPGEHASFRILEVGCGVGNSVFPIINSIKEKDAFLYCCDFSPCAIQMVKDHPDYDDSVCHAFVHDICEEVASFPFPPQSLDVILAVFVLSSIHPDRIQGVVNRLSTHLKHGGTFLFRDYGRYDFSQLRFKKAYPDGKFPNIVLSKPAKLHRQNLYFYCTEHRRSWCTVASTGQCLSENFYSRGDGTCVYFFTKEEVHDLFSNAGLEEVQNLEDRRLQVNRGKKVAMRRVWMQSKYRKLCPPSTL